MMAQRKEASKLGYYENRLKETQKQIMNILRAVEMGVVTDEFKDRLDELNDNKRTLQGKIAIEKMNLLQVDRPKVIYFLETIRNGNPKDPEFQKRIIRDFVRAVYLYDGYFKLVVDFTGKNVSYEIPVQSEIDTDNNEAPIEAAKGLYRRTLVPPQFPYTNPCHASSIELLGQGFVITWYYDENM